MLGSGYSNCDSTRVILAGWDSTDSDGEELHGTVAVSWNFDNQQHYASWLSTALSRTCWLLLSRSYPFEFSLAI